MRRLCTLLVALILAAPATAQNMDYVTDPKLCPMEEFDRQEMGMTFDGLSFWEIEYHCELASPMNPVMADSDTTQIRAGYCEEPGFLYPTVFVFRTFGEEPGTLRVYQGNSGEPQLFYNCRN